MSYGYMDQYLGRYEGEARNGMTMCVTLERVDDHTVQYTYGAKGFPPKETRQIPTSEVRDRLQNLISKGYRLAASPEEVREESQMNANVKGFDFSKWAERR